MGVWKIKEVDSTKAKILSDQFKIPQAIANILVSRSYDTPEKVQKFTTVTLDQLGSPFGMAGMDDACDRLIIAIKEKQKIIIHGDFDADGITSSALLTLFLREIGCDVETFIPNRLEEGHGLSNRFIEHAKEKNAKLVVTCDCGSSNEKEIVELDKFGIDTIVTDHHHITKPLSRGIIINPQTDHTEEQPEELSGVGVVFMLLMALRKKLRDVGYFQEIPEPNLKKYLDIVALGTIADMAPLVGYNRVLVVKGLEELQHTKRPGFLAMKEKIGISSSEQMHAYDVGFRLAPRINAAARMGHAMEAFEIMVSEQPLTVLHLSQKLEEWNEQRKKIQTKMVGQCEKELERQKNLHEVLVFASPEFHPGVIGLAAQKISGETLKPCFVFRIENDIAKGSARCRAPFHLVEMMDSVKDLLQEYGGHREAGGCKLPTKHLQEFVRRIQDTAKLQKVGHLETHKDADSIIALDDLDIGFLDHLYRIGPFGMGNPEPIFSATARVVGDPRQVGSGHLKATVAGQNGKPHACIAFGKWEEWKDTLQGQIQVYFHIQSNFWNGKSAISLQLQDFKA